MFARYVQIRCRILFDANRLTKPVTWSNPFEIRCSAAKVNILFYNHLCIPAKESIFNYRNANLQGEPLSLFGWGIKRPLVDEGSMNFRSHGNHDANIVVCVKFALQELLSGISNCSSFKISTHSIVKFWSDSSCLKFDR